MASQSLDEIYRFYMRDVHRYLFSLCRDHHLAEDLLQETFFRAYLHIEELHDEKVKPWLFRVAYNVFVDHYRKEKRNVVKDESFFQQFLDKVSTERMALLREQVREVEQIMLTLPEKQRHAMILVDFHDMSYKEAASIMGITLSHLKILLFRARQAVRLHQERNEPRE